MNLIAWMFAACMAGACDTNAQKEELARASTASVSQHNAHMSELVADAPSV